jgi:hypothetical protein
MFGTTWTFNIELDAAPSRMTFEAVTRAVAREVPFAFTDIPLPE